MSWSSDKRIEFIDYQLYWTGRINRRDLIERFAISVPQAVNDLGRYRELAPDSMVYDASEKAYLATTDFRPTTYKPDPDTFLLSMTRQVDDNRTSPSLPPHDVLPMPRRKVDPEILRAIVTAIQSSASLKIRYQSLHSPGRTMRVIAPHALASDGYRWHTRAWCDRRKAYSDFVLARIGAAEPCRGGATYPNGATDESWHTMVKVVLTPNPDLTKAQKSVIMSEYGMVDGTTTITVRRALLFYLLTELRIDFDPGSKGPTVRPIVVANEGYVLAELKKTGFDPDKFRSGGNTR